MNQTKFTVVFPDRCLIDTAHVNWHCCLFQDLCCLHWTARRGTLVSMRLRMTRSFSLPRCIMLFGVVDCAVLVELIGLSILIPALLTDFQQTDDIQQITLSWIAPSAVADNMVGGKRNLAYISVCSKWDSFTCCMPLRDCSKIRFSCWCSHRFVDAVCQFYLELGWTFGLDRAIKSLNRII